MQPSRIYIQINKIVNFFKKRLDGIFIFARIAPVTKTYAGIAQLVEHDLAKVGVASSSLVSRSKLSSRMPLSAAFLFRPSGRVVMQRIANP